MNAPSFPPLMSGQAVAGSEDPFDSACMQAALGCDAGLITYNLAADTLKAALIFAPEVPLKQAMAMLPACGLGLQNALGALAPPEVAMHLGWNGNLYLNGGRCGGLRIAAATDDASLVPNWLVVGFDLPLWPASEDSGDCPDDTALYAEGCADVSASDLLESWARHTLHWINRWEDDGPKSLHEDWRGLAHGLGEATHQNDLDGTFLGVDEDFGMLLRDDATTHLIPLTTLLETP